SGGGYGGYGYRGWGGMGGMGTATTTTSEYIVGTLVVDIFDAKTKGLMFRGTATDELSDKPEKNAKKLQKASDKLFKDFPPGSNEKKEPTWGDGGRQNDDDFGPDCWPPCSWFRCQGRFTPRRSP